MQPNFVRQTFLCSRIRISRKNHILRKENETDLSNPSQHTQKSENSEQSSESLFRKRFESKLHIFTIKHFEVI